MKRDPAIIHEVLGADEYVYLQTPTIGDRIGDINSPSFPYVFEYLLHEYEQARPPKWELPLPASDFVDFLTSGPTKQCDRVLHYTTQRVLFLSQNDTPNDKSTMEVHTTLPYLWFMVHLAIRSKFACQGIVDGNILEILRNLWKSSHLSLNGTNQVQQDLERLCCILLGAISYQRVFPRLVGQLLDFDATWFLNIFPRFISEFAIISSICLPYLPAILPDDRSEFYRELLVLAGYYTYYFQKLYSTADTVCFTLARLKSHNIEINSRSEHGRLSWVNWIRIGATLSLQLYYHFLLGG